MGMYNLVPKKKSKPLKQQEKAGARIFSIPVCQTSYQLTVDNSDAHTLSYNVHFTDNVHGLERVTGNMGKTSGNVMGKKV